MRVALIPLQTLPRCPQANLEHLQARLAEAQSLQADLVCLPECTFTGYLYQPEDLERFAEPLTGPTVAALKALARRHGIWLCFGMLEKTERGIYDTALLLDREGEVRLVQRKISEKPPFARGGRLDSVTTELGRLSILICGDLFAERVIAQVREDLDLVIVPMARAFAGCSPDRERWEREERRAYLQAVGRLGVPALLVNALEVDVEEPSFGGALVVGSDGALLAEARHGTDEILVHDI